MNFFNSKFFIGLVIGMALVVVGGVIAVKQHNKNLVQINRGAAFGEEFELEAEPEPDLIGRCERACKKKLESCLINADGKTEKKACKEAAGDCLLAC